MEQCIKEIDSPQLTIANGLSEIDHEMNFEVPELRSKVNSKATEYDRFIPQRQPDCGLGSNFENKDYIFSE